MGRRNGGVKAQEPGTVMYGVGYGSCAFDEDGDPITEWRENKSVPGAIQKALNLQNVTAVEVHYKDGTSTEFRKWAKKTVF